LNEQKISGERQITKVNDVLHPQAMKATFDGVAELELPLD
jgi:hypothetical protein